MEHLSGDELQELRATLEAERATLEGELAEHGSKSGGDWQGTSSGLSGEEADPTDVADQIEELVTNVPVVEELEKRLVEVKDALEKIENGTYGIDERTGEPISADRLRANPAARGNL